MNYSENREVFFVVIFGIDPGYAIVGCGIVRYEHNNFSLMGYGAVTTDRILRLINASNKFMTILPSFF